MSSNQSIYGYAYELIVAEAIMRNSAYSCWIQNPSKHREEKLVTLKKSNTKKYEELFLGAEIAVKNLPKSKGPVFFNDISANGSNVYDLYYYEDQSNRINISCKTSKTEDKSYRFSTKGYELKKCVRFLGEVLVDENDTYENNIKKHGYKDVPQFLKFFRQVVRESLYEDKYVFEKLINEKFIGNGGFYKVVGNGEVEFYPERNRHFSILYETIQEKSNSIIFDVTDGSISYRISFRVKFKDGKNKKVTFSSNGTPNNIAATVRLEKVSNSLL